MFPLGFFRIFAAWIQPKDQIKKRKKSRRTLGCANSRLWICGSTGGSGKFLLALIGLPYFIASTVVNAIVWIPTLIIKGKLKDKAFSNTVCFGGKFLLSPMVFIGGTIALFCTLPWYWALGGAVLLFFSYDFWYDYQELVRRLVSDIRWAFKGKLRQEYRDLNLNDLF